MDNRPNGHDHSADALVPVLATVPTEAHALAIQRPPDVVIEEARLAAKAIASVIEQKPNPVKFRGQIYLQFEDWQTVGRFYGVTAKVTAARFVEYGDDVRGFEATADAVLVSTGQVISSAEAMCLNDEDKWSVRPKYEYENGRRNYVGSEPVPLFQLKSMAQTRACAKALRNVLAWVVVLAGYSPTPAEEMDSVAGSDDAQAQESTGPKRKGGKPSKSSTKAEAVTVQANQGDGITFVQQKELFDIAERKGWSRKDLMAYFAKLKIEQPGEIPSSRFAQIREALERA